MSSRRWFSVPLIAAFMLVACSGDDKESQASADGESLDPSGAGDVFGAVLAVAAGSASASGVDSDDGWSVRYDRLLVNVGAFTFGVSGAAAAADDHASPNLLVVDLRAAGTQIASFDRIPVGTYDTSSFTLESATATSMSGGSADDLDLMQKGGFAAYIEGTIESPDGLSCDPADPDACVKAPSIAFAWGIPADSLFSSCAPIEVREDQTTTVTLTLDVDRWLRPDFRAGASDRLAQWIADADLDHDGVTTVDELQSIQADVLLRPDRGYDLSAATTKVDTVYDFLDAQVRLIGIGAGGCSDAAPIE